MTLEILHGTANEAMLELTDSIIITDGVSQDQVGLISFIAMMKGKEKNEAFKSGKINSICGEATTKLIGQGECVGPMTFSCEKKSEEKVPQEVIDAKDNPSASQPPSVEAEIINPGFEEGSTGWSMGKTAGTTCSFTIDSDSYEGSNAAKLTVTNDGYCMLGNSVPIQIAQTGTYRFSSRAKVSGDIHHVTIAIWKSDDQATPPDTLVDFINPNFSGNYDLNQLTVVLSAGEYIRLELGIDSNASGKSSVLFDSLVLGID